MFAMEAPRGPSMDPVIPEPPWRAAPRERPARTPLTREAIVDAALRVVASEIETPPPDPARWQEQLKEFGIQARRVFQRHPGVAGLTLGRVPVGPNLIRWTEWTLTLLRGAGVPDRIAAFTGDLFG